MTEEVSLPVLLRKARKAVSSGDYEAAEPLYAQILQAPEMANNLDFKMRHAVCAEKVGKIDLALKTYQEIVVIYHEQGELSAAESIEKSIAALYSAAENEIERSSDEAKPVSEKPDVIALEEPELMQELLLMGEQKSLYPTEVLCDVETLSGKIWLIDHGILDVHLPDYAQPSRLEAKDGALVLAGEIGLFTRQRRVATLVAETSVSYTEIDNEDIRQRQKIDPPFDAGMKRLLCERWVDPVLKQHSVFERINDFGRRYLANSFERMTLEAGETLMSVDEEHDGAYILQSGCMFLTYDEDNTPAELDEEFLMTGVHPGDLLHLSGLIRGYKSKYKIVAATKVELLFLSRERFEIFSHHRPWIIQALVRYSRRPAHLQVMHPQDDYLWQANRGIKFRRAC